MTMILVFSYICQRRLHASEGWRASKTMYIYIYMYIDMYCIRTNIDKTNRAETTNKQVSST